MHVKAALKLLCFEQSTQVHGWVQVRSCTLDTWLPEQVAFMARTGNTKANAYYEAKLEPSEKPSYNSADLEAFIRRKVRHPEIVSLALRSPGIVM